MSIKSKFSRSAHKKSRPLTLMVRVKKNVEKVRRNPGVHSVTI